MNVNSYLQLSGLQSVVAAVMVFCIAVLGPAWDAVTSRKLQAHCDSAKRVRHYAYTLGSIWLFVGLSFWVFGAEQVFTSAGWLQVAHRWALLPFPEAMLVVFITLFVLATCGPFVRSLRNPKIRDAYARGARKLSFRFMFPTSQAERRWYALLSISAGFGEEVLMRGFLTGFFFSVLHFDPISALVVASLLFGMNHSYQGLSGVIKTGVTGAIMGALFALTGSLWCAIVLHAAVDLVGLSLLPFGWENEPGSSELRTASSPVADPSDSVTNTQPEVSA